MDFNEINEIRKLKNESVFSTARNAAAGSLRTLGKNYELFDCNFYEFV